MTALLLILAMGASDPSPSEAPVVFDKAVVDGKAENSAIVFDTPLQIISGFNIYENLPPGVYVPDAQWRVLDGEVKRLQRLEKDGWRTSNSFFLGLGVGAALVLTIGIGLFAYFGVLH